MARRPPSDATTPRMAPRRRKAPEAGTNQAYAADLVSDEALDLAHIDGRDDDSGADSREKTPEERKEEERKAETVRRGKRYFKISEDAYDKQRRQELEDRRFARGLREDVWPAEILKARQGSADGDTNGGKPTPPRPCLTLDKLAVPRRQVMNEARESKLSIRVSPKAGRSSKDDAQLYQSAVRAIEVESKAHQARLWALDSATTCGRGYYRVLTKYANDRDTDLDIVVKRIKNQHSVYPDPWHTEIDGSDMRFCIITEDIPRRSFPSRYPNSKLAKKIQIELNEVRDGRDPVDVDDMATSTEGLSAQGDEVQGWITEKVIRVAEMYEVEDERRDKVFLPVTDERTGEPTGTYFEAWADELPPEKLAQAKAAFGKDMRVRTIVTPKVKWCAFTSDELLDEEDWPGRYIPIVQVVGEEYNVAGETTYKGIVTGGKDAQRSYNYHRSKQVETVGLAPTAPFVAAEGQTEDYPEWLTANTANHAVLVYKATDHQGNLLPPPQRNVAEPAIQAVTLAAQAADEDLKDITGRHEASLGKYRANQSGKAIQTLQQQAQQGSSHYLINLAEISIAHEARIIIDLLPAIYDRPGRVMRLVGEKGRDEYAPIGVPFVQAPGGPQALPPGHPPNQPVPVPQGPGQPPVMKTPKIYKFDREAEFTITVGVGPSQQNQKEQNQQMVSELMTAVPALAPLVADIYAKQMDGDIGDELAQRLKLAQPALAGLPEDETDLPPEAQSIVQGLKMQLQQAQQAIQQMQQQIQGDQVKMQGQMAIAERTSKSRENVAALMANTQLSIAKLNAIQKTQGGEMDNDTKEALQEAQHAHERVMLMLEQQFAAATRDDENEMAEREADRASAERHESLAFDMAKEKVRAASDERKIRTQAELNANHERVKGAETRRTAAQKAALDVATRPADQKTKSARASKN